MATVWKKTEDTEQYQTPQWSVCDDGFAKLLAASGGTCQFIWHLKTEPSGLSDVKEKAIKDALNMKLVFQLGEWESHTKLNEQTSMEENGKFPWASVKMLIGCPGAGCQ